MNYFGRILFIYKNNILCKTTNTSKFLKRNLNQTTRMTDQRQSVGCLIDIDGVIWHGGVPFENTKKALKTLHEQKIPYVFVTNATTSPIYVADRISSLCEVPVKSEQVVAAQSPCINLTQYHNKHVLLCCQNDGIPLAKELGFKNFITIPQLVEIFPDLDYIDHERRKMKFNKDELDKVQKNFQPIELILCLGEPVAWESALQIVIDLLMTNGDPRADPSKHSSDKFSAIPNPHIPIIACNKDLTFKGAAKLPRFGHGAFLECLEHLYHRVTKHELKYEKLLGKPYMPTYKFAVQSIEKLNDNKPFDKFFIIGDNPDVDIKGANLFNFYLEHKKPKDTTKKQPEIESILVCTGVYNPTMRLDEELDKIEIENFAKLSLGGKLSKSVLSKSSSFDLSFTKPTVILNDILDAVHHIVKSI